MREAARVWAREDDQGEHDWDLTLDGGVRRHFEVRQATSPSLQLHARPIAKVPDDDGIDRTEVYDRGTTERHRLGLSISHDQPRVGVQTSWL